MQLLTKQPQADEADTREFGNLTVVAKVTVDGGYAINVFSGPNREDDIVFTTPDRGLYKLVYAVIRDGGRQGVQPAGIREAIRDALTQELHRAQRRRDADAGRLVEAINDALDRMRTPAERAADDALVADIAATMKRTLADAVPAGTHRQVRPTMAGAHLAPLTPAGQRAINAHRNGLVHPGNGITRPTLRSLARKGYGTLTYRGRTAEITGLILNKRGMCAVKAEGGVR